MDKGFYIGWMDKAPGALAKQLRLVAFLLVLCVIVAGLMLSLSQRKFSTATFEYGQLTEVNGIFQRYPVPSIRVQIPGGNNSVVTMPLVGYGKFGADGAIAALEGKTQINFDNKQISMRGTLLYADGKSLLQIDEHDNPLVNIKDVPAEKKANKIEDMGFVELTGEVIDPKCYFGVMKPGYGKPHLDCAARCIAGGISPVFYVRNNDGVGEYYLLLGEQGERINKTIKDFVGKQVRVRAKELKVDDWRLLYLDTKSVQIQSEFSWWKGSDNEISCSH